MEGALKGFSQEEIDAYIAKQKEGATRTASVDKSDRAPGGLLSEARQMVKVFFFLFARDYLYDKCF